MSRRGYVPMDRRISRLCNLVEESNIESNDPIVIERYNALEEALAIIENREAVLKEVPNKKAGISRLFNKLKVVVN